MANTSSPYAQWVDVSRSAPGPSALFAYTPGDVIAGAILVRNEAATQITDSTPPTFFVRNEPATFEELT
jgi:hypothetical protein